jgi:murein DD-endopeptidase MepM/ murein hydrolase activator NlpD
MENHMVRQHYGRRPVANKRRKKTPGPGGNSGVMPLMARQLLICSLLFLLILLCKNLNLSATNYVTQNVKYILGHHVELKSVFSYAGKLADDIRDSIAPVTVQKPDGVKSRDTAGTPQTGNDERNGTASVSGLDLAGGTGATSVSGLDIVGRTGQNALNATAPANSQTSGAIQVSGTDPASNNTPTSGTAPASNSAPASSNIIHQEPSEELEEESVENTDTYDHVGESMPESSVLAATSEGEGHSASGMTLPVEGTVSSNFSDKTGSTGEKAHKGIDIAVSGKCIVRAALDGKVTETGASPAYGSYIRIKHSDGLQTVYANCSSLGVSKNTIVKKGDTIASIGGTGPAVGIHLHFEVWRDGLAVNPLEYLKLPGR